MGEVDTSNLETITPATNPLEALESGQPIPVSEGIPYAFCDIVQAINEQLLEWEVGVIPEEDGERLVLTCPKHTEKTRFENLVKEKTKQLAQVGARIEPLKNDLIQLLTKIEVHLGTLAQEDENRFYSMTLAESTAKMLARLIQH